MSTIIRTTIVGKAPLLMDPVTDEVLESLRTKVSLQANTDISRVDLAKSKVYRDDSGVIGIPAVNLLSTLVEAGRHLAFNGKTKVSTIDSTLLYSFLEIDESFFPLHDGKGTRLSDGDGNGHKPDWKVDVRRGVMPVNNAMVCLIRPRFDNWAFDCTIRLDETTFNADKVRELFRLAGTRIGLCSFRPSCRGPFGRFGTARWDVEVVKDEGAGESAEENKVVE